MADLNALIAQGYQFQPLPDPFVQYGKMQQLQQGQQANQLNQLNIQKTQRDFEEQNQLRGLDPTSPTYLSDVTKISPKLGLEFGKLRQEGENAKLEFKTKNTALLKNKIDMLPEAYARADTPEAYISLHESIHADPELGPWLNSIGATKEQGRAKINEAIQNGTFAQLRAGSMQSVADIKDQMGNVAYAADAQGAGGPAAAAPAVVQQSEGAGPIRESAPSSALVTPLAPAINALAAVSPADKFKDRIKAIDAEVARGNSNPAFNKSTAWADAKKRLEEERKSLMLSADQQIKMVTPNPVQTRLGNVIITRDMNPNSLTYGKEIQPREEIGLTAEQALKKTTPTPVDTRLGDKVVTRDMNPNSATYGQVISTQTINQTLNEQYNQTAPKPVDTRLGDTVVTRDMNPGSPTYNQVISRQTIGPTADQAFRQANPTLSILKIGQADGSEIVVAVNTQNGTYRNVVAQDGVYAASGPEMPISGGMPSAAAPSAATTAPLAAVVDNASVGGAVNNALLNRPIGAGQPLISAPKPVAPPADQALMTALGFPLTTAGYTAFKDAQRQDRLLNPAEEAQKIRIANASRPPGAAKDDPNITVASTQVDSAGNVTFYNKFGKPISTQKGAGKPSAAFEKTAASKVNLARDLDQAIAELTAVTKDGGLIDQSTGSGVGRAVDVGARFFGRAMPGDIAIGKLQPVADLALKMVPRFEGPQSNADTTSYKQAAGQLADPTLPPEIRKAAGKTVLRLMIARKGQFTTADTPADGAGGAATGVDTRNPLLN